MKKIMIVDDSATVRQQLVADLSDLGLNIIQAQDGKEGLETALANPDINLIITDMNMPVMDGLDFLNELKSKDQHLQTPKLMLTTESGSDLKAKGKAAGVVAWITKPHDAQSLKAAVKHLLRI